MAVRSTGRADSAEMLREGLEQTDWAEDRVQEALAHLDEQIQALQKERDAIEADARRRARMREESRLTEDARHALEHTRRLLQGAIQSDPDLAEMVRRPLRDEPWTND